MAISCVDRISGLPQLPLQHVLGFLSLKDAARTCVLSKSWRHQWCTRPNVEFREDSFNRQIFKSVVDKTLQRYLDQNLSIHEFRLILSDYYNDPWPAAKLLTKWIPRLKISNIYLLREGLSSLKFDIPSSVFEAKSVQKLSMRSCTLDQKCVVNVLFKHLKTLHLQDVHIADETLKKIISSCPLIESATFHFCEGLSAIKVDDKLHNLKHFDFMTYFNGSESIEIDVPSSVIERIVITNCSTFWFRGNQRNLKSLSLTHVRLPDDFISWNNMPSLEFLKLESCYGFKEFHLSSHSIKHLSFNFEPHDTVDRIFEATIDAPNILYFNYSSFFLPTLFSLATTDSSREWKSKLRLKIYGSLCCFLKLYELLKELRGSKISVELYHARLEKREITRDAVSQDKPYNDKKPVVVEHLKLWLDEHSKAYRSDFLNELFGVCHPRKFNALSTDDFLSEFLAMDTRKKRHYKWQQDLEEVSKETYDFGTNGRYYHDFFLLKWREI